MNIVYTCQDNYANIAGVSIYSLLKSNSDNEIHIYFLDSGLTEESKKRMRKMCFNHKNAQIDFFDVSNLLKKYSEKLTAFQNNYATYAKLFMELLLPKNLEECLYIDADTLILNSINSIFNEKNDCTLYMGYDVVYPKHKTSLSLNPQDKYFNAGVIFVNLNRWRENNYSDKIISLLSKETSYIYGDQDIFNTLFRNDIGVIGFENNVITQFFFYKKLFLIRCLFNLNDSNFYAENSFDFSRINIIHFTFFPFMLRPWYKKSNHPFAKKYLEIIKESPYADIFKIVEAEQPFRRRIIQIMPRNFVFDFFVGIISKRK